MVRRELSIDVDLPARAAQPLSAGSRLITVMPCASQCEILRARAQAVTTVLACRGASDGA